MKIITTINGSIRIELQSETADDKHVLEMIKDKSVNKITVSAAGDGELKGVCFEMVKNA